MHDIDKDQRFLEGYSSASSVFLDAENYNQFRKNTKYDF